MNCVFTIDVEDWFHILDVPSTPDISQWDALPSHVEKNFLRLLDILSESNVRATCFFLGWVANRFPRLVREAVARGHEAASHSYEHRLVFQMTPEEFQRDAMRAKKAIEDACGEEVLGYRAPGFSVTEKTPWFFDALIAAGYRYDSSVFPAPRSHGGLENGQYAPYRLGPASNFIEFPVSIEPLLGKPLCFFGGGYLRIFPYPVIRKMTRRVLRQERPVIFYVHPREIDPRHPRLEMSARRRFQSYVNLASTEPKIRKLTADFPMSTFRELLRSEGERRGAMPARGAAMQPVHGGKTTDLEQAKI
ncbi:MAG TPA: XrtA system polysaccharide deacetylase [Candidatus Acidoferrales bacterium]|nr:XrtA system polysaccharide deacetylase [Candidatus Acidoferrales bacterium]